MQKEIISSISVSVGEEEATPPCLLAARLRHVHAKANSQSQAGKARGEKYNLFRCAG